MTTKVLKEILELKERVNELTKELKTLHWLLSKTMNRKKENCYNRYAWNRYYDKDEMRKRYENYEFYRDKAKKEETNPKQDVRYEKFLEQRSVFHQKAETNSKQNQPEPMEVNIVKSKTKNVKDKPEIEKIIQEKQEFEREQSKVRMERIQKNEKQKIDPVKKEDKRKLWYPAFKICEPPRKEHRKISRDQMEAKNKETQSKTEVKGNTSSVFLKRINNKLSFERRDLKSGKKLIGLIDAGVCNNYITRKNVRHGELIRLTKPFEIKTTRGKVFIEDMVKIDMFSHTMNFFIVDYLENFDLSIGMDSLRKLNAKIDFKSFQLSYTDKNKAIL